VLFSRIPFPAACELLLLNLLKHYQQPLDITINEGDECYFRVTGTHAIYLTGNFIVPEDEIISDSEEESDDEDEMDELDDELLGRLGDDYDDETDEDEEDDELDDLEDPRVTEVDSDDDGVPQLVKVQLPSKKTKNKRPAEESDEEDEVATEDVIKNILKADKDDKKLSKRQAKKLKNNAGQAVPGADEKEAKKDDSKKDAAAKKDEQSPGNGKKVQFAEKLEQGPSGAKAGPKGVRVVNGVNIDDKKAGSGPGAKKGDKIGMRYIGKLKDGKVFDCEYLSTIQVASC
jgi:FK506-binding nuclear protein